MDRLTTNKPAREMTMTELAHNGCYRGKDGWARYRDYDTDIDARDFARKLLERYAPDQEIPQDTRDLEDMLFDALQFGAIDNEVSLIASMYAMMWAMADLREHLAAYEDTGLEPETLSEILDGVGEWYDAYKEGRLIVLPCKVGDMVWQVHPSYYGARQVTYHSAAGIVEDMEKGWGIGNTIEEAEAALGGDGE